MLKSMGIDLEKHKWFKVTANALVLVAMVLGLSLAPFLADTAQAHGGTCYQASKFEIVWARNEWHWRAAVGVPRPTPQLTAWHVHGPAFVNAQLWPDSVRNGVVYIYFRYPSILNPANVFGYYQFQACLNSVCIC